jgi:phosphomannomutase
MTPIKFGTDGWRAIIAEDFTFANVDRVAQATADYWKSNPVPDSQREIVVGYDRRFLSDRFGQRVATVLAGNGFKVCLGDVPTPTPAVSLAVKSRRATGGVMVTASHNPPAFNGYKLKAWYGGSAEPALCGAIEDLLDRSPVQSMEFDVAVAQRRIVVRDLRTPHFKALKKLVNFPLIARSRLRFAHDAMYGVGAGCFEAILAGTTCRVTGLNAEHNPNFGGISPEPIASNYTRSAAWLAAHPQDLCVVTDGDADRVGGMMGNGAPLTTHQINCLLLLHFVRHRNGRGRVVRSLTVTSMIDAMCKAYDLPVVETAVGFKHIAAEMLKGDVLLGFEESGGIGFPDHIPERDGLAAGLMLLELLASGRKPLARWLDELEREFGPHHFGRIDTTFPVERRASLMANSKECPPAKLLGSPVEKVQSFDGIKFTAANGSWLMLRGSGTEPILRIYAEARSPGETQSLLKLGVKLARAGGK